MYVPLLQNLYDSFSCSMTVLKTETEIAVFSRNTDRNRPSSDDPEP